MFIVHCESERAKDFSHTNKKIDNLYNLISEIKDKK